MARFDGLEHAAEELRPAEAPDVVTIGAAASWLRCRLAWVRVLLVTVAGLFPDRFADPDQEPGEGEGLSDAASLEPSFTIAAKEYLARMSTRGVPRTITEAAATPMKKAAA